MAFFAVTHTSCFLFLESLAKARERASEAELKANLASLQMALQKYSTDHKGQYPLEIQELVSAGIIDRLPRNPFASRGPGREVEMKPVPWGKRSAGDFSYWVDRKREAYCLAAYGADRNPGLDNTGIIVLYFSYGEELPSEADPTLPRICRDRVTSPPGK
jgi:hypothetical protein